MLAGATDNSPARLEEPNDAASTIDIRQADLSEANLGQIWSFAPTVRCPRMRIFLRLLVDRRSIRRGPPSFERNRASGAVVPERKGPHFSLPVFSLPGAV